jgi:hypothetical protein
LRVDCRVPIVFPLPNNKIRHRKDASDMRIY